MRFAFAALLAGAAWAANGAGHVSSLPLQAGRHIAVDTDSGTWLSPDLAPDGQSIVFELLGDLYRIGRKAAMRKR